MTILYRNPDRASDGEGYDRTYTRDRARFTHDTTFWALDLAIATYMGGGPVQGCLDIGCGQGQVLAHVAASHAQPDGLERMIGVDLSPVAVAQCDAAHPELVWALDTLQDFLRSQTHLRGQLDLVINKGGFTYVESERDYVETLDGIASLLSDDGMFFYMTNKAFYDRWAAARALQWSRDVFSLMEERMGPPVVIPNSAYYIQLYGPATQRIAVDGSEGKARPIDVAFHWEDGGARRVVLADRAHVDRATAAADLPPPAAPYVRDRAISPARDRRVDELLAIANRSTQEGVSHRVVLTATTLRASPEVGVGLGDRLVPVLSESVPTSYYPQALNGTAAIEREVFTLLRARPSIAVLVQGLDDFYLVDGVQLMPIEEYLSRWRWITETLNRHGCHPVVVAAGPAVDWESEDGGRSLRREDATARLSELAPTLAPLDATVLCPSPPDDVDQFRDWALDTVDEIAHLVRKAEKPVSRTETLGPPDALHAVQLPSSAKVRLQAESLEVAKDRVHDLFFALRPPTEAMGPDTGSSLVDKSFQQVGGRTEREAAQQIALLSSSKADSTASTNMPTVLVIGDSSRMRLDDATGWGPATAELLRNEFYVPHIPHCCGGTRVQSRFLADWLTILPDLVVLNAGHQDCAENPLSDRLPPMASSPTEYESRLHEMVALIRSKGVPHIIWANSTPVHPLRHRTWPGTKRRRKINRSNEQVSLYNRIAEGVMTANDITIVDLHSLVLSLGINEALLADGLHLSTKASAACGAEVARSVREVLAG